MSWGNHPEPELQRSGQSLKNWVRRQLSRNPIIHRRELTKMARAAGYVPTDARGSQWMGGTLRYLRDRGEVEIHDGMVHAVALRHRLDTSDAFGLTKLVRRRLRGRSVVSRRELRTELRADRRLAYGIPGQAKLWKVLKELVRQREIAMISDTIIPLAIRPEPRPRKRHAPPSAKEIKRRAAEQRARRAARRRSSDT
ncbi:hypothetical protein V5F29_10915 [Xanthobacter aminoxidans]|uniref:hypothetical protein n=1 Tax=Xanthobacter aminoxidans TaxID=186280 RepID=UPI00372C2E0A